jgi:serine/threonine protein kinase
MDAAQSLHPTDQTLRSYGLRKLDDRAAEAVNEHLMECSACRKRVAEMSADSFLQKVRDAQKPSGNSRSSQPQAAGTPSDQAANTLTSSSDNSISPELATHPDYEIKRELGRGGMGIVYLAHNRLMDRDEVLKVTGQHLVDFPGVLERFLREIRSVARLRHPNIVTAYHASRFGPSVLFAMEYVEGLDLSRLVKAKGPMPVAHACLFIHEAALGLQHAYEKGLIHRDIKPHNLILSREGNKAAVKILDFGLAKAAREEKVEGGLTATGQALGTPDYMAPEQIIDTATADIRADIYSLGCTLYYLLTGHPPFQAKTLYELYQAHISRIADPLNLVRPDVPAELAALVAKMMEKDPVRRFQTPGEVAQALKPFCTTANAALKSIKGDNPQEGSGNAGRSVAERALAETQLETDAERRIAPIGSATEPSGAVSPWESIVDFRDTESSQTATPDGAPARRPPWLWPSAAGGILVLGLFVAWMSGVKVKTPDGVIVLEKVPKDSEILVDGSKITFAWPGGGKPVEIRAVPGQHRVEVSKDGFQTFGAEVAIKTGGSEVVTVRLEPVPDPGPEVLSGTITKVDVEGQTLTIESKNDGKVVRLSTNGNTEFISKVGRSKIDLEKMESAVRKSQDAGKKGVLVDVTHARGLASMVSTVSTLLGVITKVDVEGKTLTIESVNDGKVVHLSTDGSTEYISKKGRLNIDLEKMDSAVRKNQDAGKKGVFVNVTYAQGVASKVSFVQIPK